MWFLGMPAIRATRMVDNAITGLLRNREQDEKRGMKAILSVFQKVKTENPKGNTSANETDDRQWNEDKY